MRAASPMPCEVVIPMLLKRCWGAHYHMRSWLFSRVVKHLYLTPTKFTAQSEVAARAGISGSKVVRGKEVGTRSQVCERSPGGGR